MKTKRMNVHLLKSIDHGYETFHTGTLPGYVQIGIAKDVEFSLASDEEQVRDAIAELEKARSREMAESQARLNSINERIQSLLAITHEPA